MAFKVKAVLEPTMGSVFTCTHPFIHSSHDHGPKYMWSIHWFTNPSIHLYIYIFTFTFTALNVWIDMGNPLLTYEGCQTN